VFNWQDWCLSVALDHQPHFCAQDKDFSEEVSRILQTQQRRLTLDNRLEQALARTEAALESLKRDAKSGKFLSTA